MVLGIPPWRTMFLEAPCLCLSPSSCGTARLSRVFFGPAPGLIAKLYSQAPVPPNVLKPKPLWQEIWPQWCQGWQSAHCPTVCQAWPAGWSLLPFCLVLMSHQAGTMRPSGFPCGLRESCWQAHTSILSPFEKKP